MTRRPFQETSDEDARERLEEILDLRRRARGNPGDRRYVTAIAEAVLELAEGIGGWAVAEIAGSLAAEEFVQLPPAEKRAVIAQHLPYVLMQPGAAKPLRAALLALNGGQVEPLLEPTPRDRNRKYPYDASRLELEMLAWIRWQKGRGRAVGETQEELAGAIGRTTKCFDLWRREIAKRAGIEFLRRQLADAEAAGRIFSNPLPGVVRDPSGLIDGARTMAAYASEIRERPYLARLNLRLARHTTAQFAALFQRASLPKKV